MTSAAECRAVSQRFITFGFLFVAIVSLVLPSCADGFALSYPSPDYAEVAERPEDDEAETRKSALPPSEPSRQFANAFVDSAPRSIAPRHGNSVGSRLSLRSFSDNADDAVVWVNSGGDPRCILCRTNYYGRARRFLKRK